MSPLRPAARTAVSIIGLAAVIPLAWVGVCLLVNAFCYFGAPPKHALTLFFGVHLPRPSSGWLAVVEGVLGLTTAIGAQALGNLLPLSEDRVGGPPPVSARRRRAR